MNSKKILNVRVILLLLLVNTILVSCGGNNIHSNKKTLLQFSELIKSGNLSDLSLTIYYMSPNIATLYPVSTERLISRSGEYKIVINGSRLAEHIDLLHQIGNVTLKPVKKKSYIDARIYYVIENNNRKIFDVSMWGKENSMFFNGLEVKETEVFYDVIIPFLSEDDVEDLEAYIDMGNQEDTVK